MTESAQWGRLSETATWIHHQDELIELVGQGPVDLLTAYLAEQETSQLGSSQLDTSQAVTAVELTRKH